MTDDEIDAAIRDGTPLHCTTFRGERVILFAAQRFTSAGNTEAGVYGVTSGQIVYVSTHRLRKATAHELLTLEGIESL